MIKPHRNSALHAALCSIIGLAAGVGIWYVTSVATSFRSWLLIPAATLLVAGVLLHMLRATLHAGYDSGVANAQTDTVTRLPSQSVARQFLLREFAAAERGRSLTIVLLSLDNLPRIAATRGAYESNRILLGVGAILKRRTRGMNMSARLDDGHTFISVLGGVDEIGAHKFVGKVTRDLASLNLGGMRIGLCGYEPGMHSLDDMVAKAHAQLIEPDAQDTGLMIA